MDMTDDQKRDAEALDGMFARGSRSVYLGDVVGRGSHRITAALIARRVAAGERCLVVHPTPRMRIDDLKRCEPGLDVGRIGSGAMVEVANYPVAARMTTASDEASSPGYGFVLMEEASAETTTERITTIRKAAGGAKVLLSSLAPPRNPFPMVDAAMLRTSPDVLTPVEAQAFSEMDWKSVIGGPARVGMGEGESSPALRRP